MAISITVDTSEVQRVFSNMGKASTWLPPVIDVQMLLLGQNITPIMREVLNQNRYKGALADSVTSQYNSGTKILEIGPNAKRGSWDAGIIFEAGTSGGHKVPWKPIREWGAFRGLTPRHSFFILKKIRREGVKGHPFLIRTIEHPRFAQELEAAAQRMGLKIAALAIAGGKPIGAAETQ